MASDITLAVGDGARRMTYAELAQARGISLASARRLARRHGWARQAGNDGVVRVTVPLPALQRAPEPPQWHGLGHRVGLGAGLAEGTGPRSGPGATRTEVPETAEFDGLGEAETLTHGARPMPTPERPTLGPGTASVSDRTDPLTAIAIGTLSQAVDMLREDLAIANGSLLSERERAERAERQLQTERQDVCRRIDELQTLLTEGRRLIDTLHIDLANARTAAMIAGSEAAALRAQADERRGWRLLRRLRWALRAASEWR